MNLLADECCDALLVNALRSDGHDVLYVKELAPGSDDQSVLQLAAGQQRILLTEDKDFGELVVRLRLTAYGPGERSQRATRCVDGSKPAAARAKSVAHLVRVFVTLPAGSELPLMHDWQCMPGSVATRFPSPVHRALPFRPAAHGGSSLADAPNRAVNGETRSLVNEAQGERRLPVYPA